MEIALKNEAFKRADTPEKKYPRYSIKIDPKKYDKKIIKEMIESVSPEFPKILRAAARNAPISDEVLNHYLNNWAIAKYELYLMFGRKLKLEENIKIAMKASEMHEKQIDLAKRFELYCVFIMQFSAEEIIENIAKEHPELTKYDSDNFKVGMKISKYFSQKFGDNNFDIEYSKILQNRFMDGKNVISIDPCDFVTMSENKHNWNSCQRIGGQYGRAAFSLMLDENTMVSYKTNTKEYEYNIHGVNFKWNSKHLRRLVFFDKNTCKMGFSRLYPASEDNSNPIKEFKKSSRELLEKAVSDYLKIPNEWEYSSDGNNTESNRIGGFHYVDGIKEYVIPKDCHNVGTVTLNAGVSELKCLCCGRTVTTGGEYLACR